MEKPGLGKRWADTNPASAMPSMLNATGKAGLFSHAICTAALSVSGCSSTLPMRGWVADWTASNPPFFEKLAQPPSKATDINASTSVRGV